MVINAPITVIGSKCKRSNGDGRGQVRFHIQEWSCSLQLGGMVKSRVTLMGSYSLLRYWNGSCFSSNLYMCVKLSVLAM